MKTANLAIVFTDIKGFTARTSQQTYEENRRMLRVHDALLMPVFKAFGGRKIKTIGDAFLVVFESPTQAVLCGVAIQDRLWDYNRRVPEADQIHVRVAINMGEVRLEGGDVFGEPVNIAARVEGLADAGEVLFTEAVHLAMNKAEVPSEDRGRHELKGIPEKVQVYRVPRGAWRIGSPEPAPESAAAAAAQLNEAAPPYGGHALSRISSNLPAPDPAVLLGVDLRGKGTALAQGAASGALTLTTRGQAALGSLLWRARASSTKARMAAAGALGALIVAGGLWSLSADPVEDALDEGDIKGAEVEVRKLEPGPWRSYLEGRIEEQRKDWDDAARRYEVAARQGSSKAFRRLLNLTESDHCWARANAAYALGRLKRPAALSTLKSMQAASFEDEAGGGNVFKEIFGCNSRRAAADAIRAVEGSKDP
ncbi:MAG: adenylate/guanylate cyclase domain-containing protein [Deltaproteobacteria bacterium]|nr:adenylate/guanylate cyclase domain-containing protein [Deltaproteobacteria bacterium]